jgi:isocitrate lyase
MKLSGWWREQGLDNMQMDAVFEFLGSLDGYLLCSVFLSRAHVPDSWFYMRLLGNSIYLDSAGWSCSALLSSFVDMPDLQHYMANKNCVQWLHEI